MDKSNKYQDKYRIDTARYKFSTYNFGVYFITICTRERKCYFGNIQLNNEQTFEMHLSEIGEYAEKCICHINSLDTHADILKYVIMPNHIHLIVAINNIENVEQSNVYPWEAQRAASLQNGNIMKCKALYEGRLSITIRSLKSAVTKYANDNKILFGWQTRYYDHIIRNQEEMRNIVSYIERNVFNWGYDKYYERE